MSIERVIDLLHDIITAASNCALYSPEHSAVKENSWRAVQHMEHFFDEEAEINLTILGHSLVFNEVRAPASSLTVNYFVQKMRRKGVEKLVLKKGISAEEVRNFVADLTARGGRPKSSEHLSVGVVEVKLRPDGSDLSAIIGRDLQVVKAAHQELTRVGKMDVAAMENVVTSFMSSVKAEADVLKVLSPIKTYSEYTFVHATNVSILAIAQAEALGIEGDVLHDVGLAGILHDVGKMFVPTEILNKTSRLEPREWRHIQNHPVMGATYLAGLPDMPSMAVIAAYEHHLKFDGSGYPEPRRRGKDQHLASQIIAIADFFDAMRSERPYRDAVDTATILGLINEAAGRDFNPLLVNNFTAMMFEANPL